jgi:hypothetical protein
MSLRARLEIARDRDDRVVLSTVIDSDDAEVAPIQVTLPSSIDESQIAVQHRGSIAAAMALLSAMTRRQPLHIDQPVSSRLLHGLDEFQRIQAAWFPDAVGVVPIIATGISLDRAPSERTATFFTGGVDSFFTLLRHQHDLDAAIYVDGFDVPLSHPQMLDRVHDELAQIGRRLDLTMLAMRSTVREPASVRADWGLIGHGHALGSTALVLGSLGYTRVLIPSTASYDTLTPWGSHPLLDHLWSTEATQVIHDGAAHDRGAKVASISTHDAVRHHLRVCWERFDALNCSQCEKCLRTMSLLLAVGALDDVTTFRPPRSLVPLARRPVVSEEQRNYAVMAARGLRRAGTHRRLARAFERSSKRYQVRLAGGRPSLVEQLEQLPRPAVPPSARLRRPSSVEPRSTVPIGGPPSVTVSIGMTGLGIPESITLGLPRAIDPSDTTAPGDLALLLGLLPAMLLGAPLRIEQPVSGALLEGVDAVQQIVASWYPSWVAPVAVHASSLSTAPPGSGSVLLVDESNAAIATALSTQHRFAALAPIATADPAIATLPGHHHQPPADVANELAATAGAPIVQLDCPVSALLGGVIDRDRLLRGIEIAVRARLLGGLGFGELVVAAPRHYRELRPAGSHPLIDRHWSTERLVVRHVDAERSTVERDALAATVVDRLRQRSLSQ